LAVARTRRVQRAKRLLDTSDLPITQVALAAGFASVRRFNAAFRETYGCAPSMLRRQRMRAAGAQCFGRNRSFATRRPATLSR